MEQSFESTDTISRRVRLSTREIAVAVALTVAAGAFLCAALIGNDAPSSTASVAVDQPRAK
jgi:hypothetical protein